MLNRPYATLNTVKPELPQQYPFEANLLAMYRATKPFVHNCPSIDSESAALPTELTIRTEVVDSIMKTFQRT